MAAFVFGVPRSLLTITTPSMHDSMTAGLSPSAEPVTPMAKVPKKSTSLPDAQTVTPKPEETVSTISLEDEAPISPTPVAVVPNDTPEPIAPVAPNVSDALQDNAQSAPDVKLEIVADAMPPNTPDPVVVEQPETEPKKIDIDLSTDQVSVVISDEPTDPSIDSFWALSYNSLKKLCKVIGVPASGSKAVLVERASKTPYRGELPGFEQLSDWYSQVQA